MTADEQRNLMLAVSALRDIGETLARLTSAIDRTLGLANQVLDRAEALLQETSPTP